MATISYAITACNESEELKRLLDQIIDHKREVDEIVVQVDHDNVTKEVKKILEAYHKEIAAIISFPLNKDFATFKNNIKSYCKKDYIFFIDADEYFSENLIDLLPVILENNSEVDLFFVPRMNTVDGLTEDHIKQWHWVVDDRMRVNWPDYQTRLVKNVEEIKWINKVHERITGFKTQCLFPNNDEEWCLYHPKNIDRQVKQNNLYSTL